MASRALCPQPAICAEKRRLTDAFYEAVRHITSLLNNEMADLTAGGKGLDVQPLQQARQHRDNTKAALMLHVQEHGC